MKDRRRKKHFSANSDIQVKGPPSLLKLGCLFMCHDSRAHLPNCLFSWSRIASRLEA